MMLGAELSLLNNVETGETTKVVNGGVGIANLQLKSIETNEGGISEHKGQTNFGFFNLELGLGINGIEVDWNLEIDLPEQQWPSKELMENYNPDLNPIIDNLKVDNVIDNNIYKKEPEYMGPSISPKT